MERLSVQGADLLSETLTKYDEITPTKQLDSEATLAPIMSKDDGLIDWKMTAFEISNRVRGFQPFPKSYTSYNGQKLTLWKTQRVQDLESDRSDCGGEIIEAKGEILLVRCGGTTVLRIDELQMAGKRRMSTQDVLNGTKLEVGEILGR